MSLKLLASSIAAAALLQRYVPRYSLGIVWNICLLFPVLLLARLSWKLFIYPTYFSPIRNVPLAPGGKFFTGHTRRVMKEPGGRPQCDWEENVPNDGLIRYFMYGQERLMPTNPKTLSEVLVTKNYDFIKPEGIRRGLGRTLGIGILLAEGDEHKVQRKNLMPAFAFRHIKDLYQVFWHKSAQMVECLREAAKKSEEDSEASPTASSTGEHAPGAINVGNWVSRATLDIIGLSGMGKDFDSLHDDGNKLNQTYRTVFTPGRVGQILQLLGVFLPFWLVQNLPLKRNRDINDATAYIKTVCRDLIANKRANIARNKRTEVDIISVALESGGFTDEELVNQMMTFLVAGHETTATAMVWAMYLLCKHPEVQKKLREEIRSQLPSLDQEITAADIDRCQYLKAVNNEILRLWAPVALTLRVAACDTSINGQFVPKGCVVIIPIWAINTSKHLWGEDAKEFRPERWLDSEGKADNKGGADSNYSFLTFLHGPRSCIGQKFAQAEFECLLAAWVGRFETEFEDPSVFSGDEFEIAGGVTAKPKHGVWVKIREVDG